MSIQVYILSKLMEGDNYPYKLKKELSDPIPFDKMGNLTESKLYYHFESLTKQGLVKPIEVIKEENRPDKQLFAITDKGREMLPLKIYELFERFVDLSLIIQILQRKIESLKLKQSQVMAIYSQISIEVSKKEMIDFAENYYSNTISNEIIWLEKLISKLNTNNH